MGITRLLDEVKKNFKAFFQVRFEKIAKYSVFDEIDLLKKSKKKERDTQRMDW